MKWIKAKVEFDSTDTETAVDVIAGVFYDLGLKGVVIDDPGMEPAEDWGEAPVARPEHPAVTGYLPVSSEVSSRCTNLQLQLKRAGDRHRIVTRLRMREIDDEDWAESWKAFFKPVWINGEMVIKPSWETVSAKPDTIVIDIDPGMAFGTGGHPTTILSLRLIREYLKKGDAFLDVGTGSGILAIGAAKLGAGSIYAVDVDETAVTVAADNFLRNDLTRDRCRLMRGHLGAAIKEQFDLVAANILTDVILELLDDLQRLSKRKGIFICSGIISQHKERVLSALEDHRFDILAIDTLENWIGIAARRRG
ncbi:MAG: 50S ribosomal protein L11 methyltransferase [Desulfobacterales bacterium]